MARRNLTDRFVESVKVETRTDFWDDTLRGLVLRVSPTGVKVWNAVYTREGDSRKRRFTIGKYPAISLKVARAKALDALKSISDGEDPAKTKQVRKGALTVEDLGRKFIELYAKNAKRTWAEDERILKNQVYPHIGGFKAQEVTKRDLLDITDAKVKTGAPVMADRILATVRKMYNWATDVEHLKENPLAGIKRVSKPVKRDRVLAVDEIKAIWAAISERPLAPSVVDILRMMFLTGQRSGEVGGMLLGELHLANRTWIIPKERSKNKKPHLVPLTDTAIAILEPRVMALQEVDAGRAAPIFTRDREPVDSRFIAKSVRLHLSEGFSHWTPHDVRRTVATGMGDLKILPHIIEATLNHISGFRSGVAGVYNLAEYAAEKREALDAWGQHLAAIIEGRTGKVVPMPRRRAKV